MNSVIGLFDYYTHIEWALEVLENYDVDSGRISVVACDKKAIEPGTDTVASGASSQQGLFSFIADGPDSFTFGLPGGTQMVATGTLAYSLFTTLNGTPTASHAPSGDLLRALVDLGFSKGEAEFYVAGVQQGGVLIVVETDVQNEYRIRAILRGAGAMDMNIYRHQVAQNKG